eukprot:c2558_g1_i1 orf=194-580(-)
MVAVDIAYKNIRAPGRLYHDASTPGKINHQVCILIIQAAATCERNFTSKELHRETYAWINRKKMFHIHFCNQWQGGGKGECNQISKSDNQPPNVRATSLGFFCNKQISNLPNFSLGFIFAKEANKQLI